MAVVAFAVRAKEYALQAALVSCDDGSEANDFPRFSDGERASGLFDCAMTWPRISLRKKRDLIFPVKVEGAPS